MMRYAWANTVKGSIACVLVLLYTTLFYLQYKHYILIDFSSLYFAAEALSKGQNPYQVLSTTFFPIQKQLPTNLNPPFVLWVAQILLPLGYGRALIAWNLLCLTAAFKTAAISYDLLQEKGKFVVQHPPQQKGSQKKNAEQTLSKQDYYLIFFALYPVFMNTAICQFGFFLSFFVLAGYQYANQNKTLRAGFCWGFIATLKLFPLLLLFYCYLTQQKKLLTIFILSFLCLSATPYFIYGNELYEHYHFILQRMLWFGDNWNASLYGLLFRVFADPVHSKMADVLSIKATYSLLFLTGLALYFFRARRYVLAKDNHSAFYLTLAMMLFLSPLGWLYYFPLLILPCFSLWNDLQSGFGRIRLKDLLLTYFSFFLLCSPIVYVTASSMTTLLSKITVFSCHFYGLLLLIIRLFFPAKAGEPSYQKQDLILFNKILLGIIAWGLLSLLTGSVGS